MGFKAHHYSSPLVERIYPPRQTLYAGLSINMQGVLRHLFADSTGRRIGSGIFEVYSLPMTTFRDLEASRGPN